jgi:hypothetical protein
MTYLYKLAKRVSRIRGAVLPLAALISACAQGSSSDPFNIGPSFAIKSSQYTRISITPRGSQLDLGKSLRLKAWAFNAAGDSASASVKWLASGGSMATNGTFSAKVAGTYVITATSPAPLSLKDTTTVTVRPGIARISVSPKATSLLPKATKTMQAIAVLTDSTQTVVTVQWSAVGGSITTAGEYTAGTTTGKYWAAGKVTDPTGKVFSDTAQVAIDQPTATLTSLVLNPGQAAVAPGGTVQFSAVPTWSDGSSTVPAITWSATGGTIDASGLYTAGGTTGTYRVIATQQGGTVADTAAVTISTTTLGATLSVPAGTTVAGGTGITTRLVASVTGSNIAGVTFGIASGPGVSVPTDMPPEVTTASAPGSYVMNWSLDPSWTPAGTYKLYARVRTSTGQTLTSSTASVTVTTATAASVSVSSTSVQPGASVTVTFSGSTQASDWIGVYVPTASVDSELDYRYLNGLKTAPTTVIASGSFSFPMPTTPGSYELRFVRDDINGVSGRTVLAKSPLITVQASTLPAVTFSASPAFITSGQSATLTWSSTNTTSCTASGGWSGTKAISGSLAVAPTASTTYTLTCIGASGTATQSTVVSISATGSTPVSLPTAVATLMGPLTPASVTPAAFAKYETDFATYEATRWASDSSGGGVSGAGCKAGASYDYTDYYDRAFAEYQMWARTGNAVYRAHADAIAKCYRDGYLAANNYRAQPNNFQLEGLAVHYLLTGDTKSRDAVFNAMDNMYPGFAASNLTTETYQYWEPRIQGRLLTGALLANALGSTSRNWGAVADSLATMAAALQHSDGSYAWPVMNYYQSNFMVGMLNYSFGQYYRLRSRNAAVLNAVKKSLGYLWGTQWTGTGFKYSNEPGSYNAPDLTGLLVFGWGFVANATGDLTYQTTGDQIFTAGIAGAYLTSQKQFNQQYRETSLYLGLRH